MHISLMSRADNTQSACILSRQVFRGNGRSGRSTKSGGFSGIHDCQRVTRDRIIVNKNGHDCCNPFYWVTRMDVDPLHPCSARQSGRHGAEIAVFYGQIHFGRHLAFAFREVHESFLDYRKHSFHVDQLQDILFAQ